MIRQAITLLQDTIDADTSTEIWEPALATTWQQSPVWIHGDVSAGNWLVQEGRLNAVIDFAQLGIGDPACDLSMARTLFEGPSREIFRVSLPFDAGTWARGRAWTLWKALLVTAGLTNPNNFEVEQAWRIIGEVLAEHRQVALLATDKFD